MTDAIGLYVHFPWCVKKCPYCDFNSHPLSGRLPEAAYIHALKADLASALADEPRQLQSVFFGGGTPSLFSASMFDELLRLVESRTIAGAEITMEANPGTLEHQRLAPYRAAGVNRISFGAQSFDAAHLAALGRIHSPHDIESSFARARDADFDNINLDLMYGLPDQHTEQALADLERAIELAPEHISWYQLTIEPKTEFARTRPSLATESSIAEMERRGLALLEQHGYERYEVSAFAKPGFRCRHNANYWRFGDYLGVGAGAHGKLRRQASMLRTRKPPQPRRYMAEPTATIAERISSSDLVFEFMLNALRLCEGVPFERFTEATGLAEDALQPLWTELASAGLVEGARIATTRLGYRYLDSVVQRFLA